MRATPRRVRPETGMTDQATSRVVLLTGAAGGIGTVMTKALIAAGHAVAAVDRDADALDRLVSAVGVARDRLFPLSLNSRMRRSASPR